MPYTLLENPTPQIEIPATGMTKQVLLNAGVRILAFGFAPTHELKQHTAPADVILHFLEGSATVTVSADAQQVGPGSIIHIPANLPHSVHAHDAVKMLLVLLPTTTT